MQFLFYFGSELHSQKFPIQWYLTLTQTRFLLFRFTICRLTTCLGWAVGLKVGSSLQVWMLASPGTDNSRTEKRRLSSTERSKGLSSWIFNWFISENMLINNVYFRFSLIISKRAIILTLSYNVKYCNSQ